MRTLYVRIVLTFVGIAFVSGMIGLLLTSLYYQDHLKTNNEEKILEMGESIRSLYEQESEVRLDKYLEGVAALGFQIYAVDEELKGRVFGRAFKHGALNEAEIRAVLDGDVYHGMREENRRVKLFSLFENSVRNTVGIPLRTKEGKAALFVRPDLEAQIGEIRVIVAVLLGFTFLTSLVLIAVSTRYVVKPLKDLKKATQQIVQGDFNVGLEKSRNRKDEIGDLADHFAIMAESIGRLDRMRQEFVANVSHEFQSPLTSMQGFARAILDNQATPEQTQHYMTIIERESRRLSSLSKQLLRLASLDRENRRLHVESFRLDEQIRQVLISLEWQWTDKALNLELDLPETTIAADAELLHEVWLNLIANGIRFSNPEDTVGIAIREEVDRIVVDVRDTGAGIPEAEIPYIFDRFHKVDKSRNRSASDGGSGLGLSIVSKIVSLHRGTIEVKSMLGEGTVFTVRLPRL